MFRDLLLVATFTDADGAALEAGIELARRCGAALEVLVPVEVPVLVPSEWGGFPAGLYGSLYDEARRKAEEHAATMRARLAGESLPSTVRVADAEFAPCSRRAALAARSFDLVLVGSAAGDTGEYAAELQFVDLLMGAGRPVLVVPAGHRAKLPPQHVLVAWKSTREAARAVHDALPLLRTAGKVSVVQVGDDADRSGADMVAHLVRHEVPALLVNIDKVESVGATLLSHAHSVGAGLVVAGAYGHSRLREQVLGGVTRALLDNRALPVLLSH